MAKNQIPKKIWIKKKLSELNLKRRNPVFLPCSQIKEKAKNLNVFRRKGTTSNNICQIKSGGRVSGPDLYILHKDNVRYTNLWNILENHEHNQNTLIKKYINFFKEEKNNILFVQGNNFKINAPPSFLFSAAAGVTFETTSSAIFLADRIYWSEVFVKLCK